MKLRLIDHDTRNKTSLDTTLNTLHIETACGDVFVIKEAPAGGIVVLKDGDCEVADGGSVRYGRKSSNGVWVK